MQSVRSWFPRPRIGIVCGIGAVALAILLPGAVRLQDDTPGTPSSVSAGVTSMRAMALNDIEAVRDGYRLRHPKYDAAFTPEGMRVTPRRGGPAWRWRLDGIRAGTDGMTAVRQGRVTPVRAGANLLRYPRGGVIEQYQMKGRHIEQQFILPAPPALHGADLVITGAVESDGAFETTDRGWRWRTADGVVSLGDVTVYDAVGRTLPAKMTAGARTTRIVVDGPALALARYPVTVDPEIGANDFRISNAGPDGDTAFDVDLPTVAYNGAAHEYLVVWSVEEPDSVFAVFGQRLRADGAEIGANDFRISDPSSEIFAPTVVYNDTDNEYLVVWEGEPPGGGQDVIYGQRLAADGTEIGANDFRISDVGLDGDPDFDVEDPAAAYNHTGNEYLVVWHGEDPAGVLASGEFEIYGQRLTTDGTRVGPNNFRISDMGVDGNPNSDASRAAVAYNGTDNEYLVVWHGDDGTPPLVNEEFEIFGQRLAADGTEIGANDFRISDMGPDGDPAFDAERVAVAYNGTDNEYLVVWEGEDDTGALVDGEDEIFGQALAADGTEIGVNDFRISDMGPDGDPAFDVESVAAAYNGTDNEYLVVWEGEDDTAPLVDNEFEIFGQALAADGTEIGVNDFRISDMGPDGDPAFDANFPAVAYNATDNEYLVVWEGDDNTGTLVEGEDEAFGQRLAVLGAGATLHFEDASVLPGGAATVEVRLNPALPVAGLQFTVQPRSGGAPTGLARLAGVVNDVENEGFTVSFATDDATGETTVLLFGAVLAPPGERVILDLVYDIDAATPIGTKIDLEVSNEIISDPDSRPVVFEEWPGAIRVGTLGDVAGGPSGEGDGLIDVLDVVKEIDYIIGILPPPEGATLVLADLNGDGRVDVLDVVRMIDVILTGGAQGKVLAGGPAYPATVSLGDVQARADGSLTVPVGVTTDGTVAGLEAVFTFDPSALAVGRPVPAGRVNGVKVQSHVEGGTLHLVAYSLAGRGLTDGNAPVLMIPVTPAEGASPALTLSRVILADWQARALPVAMGTDRVTVSTLPSFFTLESARPNPFNPNTIIAYEVPRRAHIRLTVYNLLGQEVVRLVDAEQTPGRYSVTWNGRNAQGTGVASGVYLYRITSSAGFSKTRRMTLLK